ncbi:cytochrome d ubiquinol oxidase subunit II [Dendrosporobacter sp. 1207_IL3150]|uniref:cytochrome d ubiquinol oxidase subunit II n=1 Tax=Dendrosporobacter sp. 1207_IL3150 TaxID=3084054 RepID=UPI002FDB1FE6
MDFNIICFGLFGFLLLGYLILEGLDYGVGMLLPFAGKTELEKQVIINSIVPVWEGHEVWLIVAGAVLFASFPEVYATLFSGLYPALFLILVTLIFRGVAIELRSKERSFKWRKICDWCVFSGSFIPPLIWGTAIASLLKGLPIDGDMQYSGTIFAVLSMYTVSLGITLTMVFLIHGSTYLALRLEQGLDERFKNIGLQIYRYIFIVFLGFFILTITDTSTGEKTLAVITLAMSFLILLKGSRLLKNSEYMLSLLASTSAIILIYTSIIIALFPKIIVSTISPEHSLDIYNSAASQTTLKIIATTMFVVLPIVIGCQAWKFYMFWERLSPAKLEMKKLTTTLKQKNKEFIKKIELAKLFSETIKEIVDALRSRDGNIIKNLKPVYFKALFRHAKKSNCLRNIKQALDQKRRTD